VDEWVVGSGGDARAGDPGDGGADPELDVVCRQVVELVTDYLEGALPHQVRDAVERHLRVCPPCVLYVEQIRATAASLREVPVESIDPSTRAHLVSAFRDLIPKSGRDPA
jgi:hypothetical protein